MNEPIRGFVIPGKYTVEMGKKPLPDMKVVATIIIGETTYTAVDSVGQEIIIVDKNDVTTLPYEPESSVAE